MSELIKSKFWWGYSPSGLNTLKYNEEVNVGGGLRARKQANNTVSWIFMKRSKYFSSPIRLKIGSWPDMSIAEAQDEVTKYRKFLTKGIHPKYVIEKNIKKNIKKFQRKTFYNVKNKSKETPKHMNKFITNQMKGDMAELKASAWLMEQGFYVFKNLSKTCGIDIIAFLEELGNCVIYPIDVKTMTRYSQTEKKYHVGGRSILSKNKNLSNKIITDKYITYSLTPVQKEMNVRILYYYSYSGKFMFQDEEEELLPKGANNTGLDRYSFDVKE